MAFSDANLVRVVKSTNVKAGNDAVSVVGWKQTTDYPNYNEADLVLSALQEEDDSITNDIIDEVCDWLEETLVNDKLGGWPFWIQSVDYPSCPKCETPMVLMLQIDSNCHEAFQWGCEAIGFITQCPNHKELFAFQWSSM